MAIVDNVDNIDGGCAGIISSDVAMSKGVPGCVSRVCVVVSLVSGVAWVLELTSAFFSAVGSSLSGGSICRAAQLYSGTGFVCMAV